MSDRPCVSVVVPAFNLGRYLPAALDSVLSQRPSGGPVQIIVVDDGSTDNTVEVLGGYAGRVQAIHQRNAGFVAAVDRGLREVRGEYVALLDADDEWPADRLQRHVALLRCNPRVGLVHGDMEVIDPQGGTLHPSFFDWKQVSMRDGRVLGDLLTSNFVSGGASTFRASLLPSLLPILPVAPYPDWWIAVNIAAVAEIAHDRAVANRYRLHGANMGLGADPARALEIERRELPFRRWMLLNLLDDETVEPRHLAGALARWRTALGSAGLSIAASVRTLLSVDPEAAASELAIAGMHRPGPAQCVALARALAHDPFDGATVTDLEIALLRASGAAGTPSPVPPPLIELQARSRLTLAWLDELLAEPSLLTAYGRQSAADADATLVILAPPSADLTALVALVSADPVLSADGCDIQVVTEPRTTPGRRLLAGQATAVLSAAAPPVPYGKLPPHLSLAGRSTAVRAA